MISGGPLADGAVDSVGPQTSAVSQGSFGFGIGDCKCCQGKGCNGCSLTLCFVGCVGPGQTSVPLSGVAVSVKRGVTTVASGTTGADGCATLDIVFRDGTETIAATKAGFENFTNPSVPLCCTTQTFCMHIAAGMFCDFNCGPVGTPLKLTDSDIPLWASGNPYAELVGHGQECLGLAATWTGGGFNDPGTFARTYTANTQQVVGAASDGRITVVIDSYSCSPIMIAATGTFTPNAGGPSHTYSITITT